MKAEREFEFITAGDAWQRRVAYIISQADGGCSDCVRHLVMYAELMFPGIDWEGRVAEVRNLLASDFDLPACIRRGKGRQV